MSIDLKDVLQALAWIATVAAAAYAIGRGLAEVRENRAWRKAQLAKSILDEFRDDPLCAAALVMVDWSHRPFPVGATRVERISREDVIRALRCGESELRFSPKEVYIRDCFDRLLDAFQRMEHYLAIRLIDFHHVQATLEYSVDELNAVRPALDRYVEAYDFAGARRFLLRFAGWKHEARPRPPCIAEAAWEPPKPAGHEVPPLKKSRRPAPADVF